MARTSPGSWARAGGPPAILLRRPGKRNLRINGRLVRPIDVSLRMSKTPLLDKHPHGRSAALGARWPSSEQRPGHWSAARPHNALADETRQSPFVVGLAAGDDGLKARNWAATINDQNRRTALETIDEGTEFVLGFGDTGFFHGSQISPERLNHSSFG